MTCEHVREQLWELAIDAFDQLEPHLSICPECAALAAAIREETPAVQLGLDEFANAQPFRAAFDRAQARTMDHKAPEPARGGWKMMGSIHVIATAAAAAAALGLGLYATGDRTHSAVPVEAPVEAPITTTACALEELQEPAMLGRLTIEQIDCIEARIADGQDEVDGLRILTVNAFSKADIEAWEDLARRLAQADPADPDLAYKLALHFSKQGADHAEDVIDYADQALEHRTEWTGETYTSRVFNLYKLRAAAGLGLFQEGQDEASRERAAELAREWLTYATVAGMDTETAFKVCRAVAPESACVAD